MRHAMLLAAASTLVAAPLAAQSGSLANRIEAVREGTVRMYFPARPGVCGDGRGSYSINGITRRWSNDSRYFCESGPVIVRIGRSDNQTVSVRTTIGGRSLTSSSDSDLGAVSAVEAARYLVRLAHTLGGSNADEALTGAALADGADVSADLRALVLEPNAPVQSRRQALFWLGQTARSTRDVTSLYESLDAFALREQFPFVLSQRRDEESVDQLIAIARGDRDMEVRKQAMFWLGQSEDPKALKFFRDVLAVRP